jgi:GT2 family glycosyltransferase
MTWRGVRSGGAHLRALAAAVWRERRLLRGRPMVNVSSDRPHPGDAVRWLGEIDVAGDTRHALFCHPASSVTFSLDAAPGDSLVIGCALLPEVWDKNTGGVEFTVTATVPATGERAAASLVVQRADAAVGRSFRAGNRWRTLRVDLPSEYTSDVTIELATRVPSGQPQDYAWAIWGEPALERRRPFGDTFALIGSTLRTAARDGLRAAARELRAASTADDATAEYRQWAEAHEPDAAALAAMAAEAARLPYRPRISIITPVYNTDPGHLSTCIESVVAQVYVNWELCLCDDASTSASTIAVLESQRDPRIRITRLTQNSHISAASNAALASATGEFVALLDHDDELTPDALFQVVRHLNGALDADVVYSDEDKRDADGQLSEPFFKPDWSPDHLLSAMYTCHLTVARRALVEHVGGFRVGYEGAQDHDLTLRLSEVARRIDHLPKVLYHWRRTPQSTATAGSVKPWADDSGRRALEDYVRRNAFDAEVLSGGVPGLYRVKFAIRGEPRVTVLVVSDDSETMDAAVDALRARTAYANHDIVPVVASALLATPAINAAVRASAATHVVVVSAALRPIDGGWLTALLEYSQQSAIGAVGGKIVYADGRLRHIGIATAIEGGPAAVFHGHGSESYGYFSSAIGVRNYAAVSGECLMTRRDVFDRLRGFDENRPWHGADVDYCSRARREGLRIVFTPYARLECPSTQPPPQWPADAAEESDPYLGRGETDLPLAASRRARGLY